MSFTSNEKLEEKILTILMAERKLTVSEFKEKIFRLRTKKEECPWKFSGYDYTNRIRYSDYKEIERYLMEKGYITRERSKKNVFIVTTL